MSSTLPLLYVNQELMITGSTEDTLYLLKGEFGFDETIYEDIQIDHPNGFGNNDSEPIRIDYIINMLNGMKQGGCTHTSIDWHVDHQTYEIEGYKISKTPQSVADELLAKKELEEVKDFMKSVAYNEYQEKLRNIENLTIDENLTQ